MTMFTEDPTLPAGALLMAAACCFVAMRARGEGKYLIWGTAALAMAGAVVVFERFWITDNERIEAVVYDVRRAVLAGDAPRVLACLTPNAQYVQSESSLTPEATRALISSSVAGAKFDVARIHALQISAGRRTRRGKAEFKAFVQGSVQGPLGLGGVAGASDTSWSLGFEETKPGVWKINRITPVSSPFNPALFSRSPTPRGAEAAKTSGSDPALTDRDEPERFRGPGGPRMTRKALARERERRRERQFDQLAPQQ